MENSARHYYSATHFASILQYAVLDSGSPFALPIRPCYSIGRHLIYES